MARALDRPGGRPGAAAGGPRGLRGVRQRGRGRRAAATGAWDVTSATGTPERAALGLTFAAPYLEVDNTLLVGPGSAIRSTADADRPGVRIAAVGGTAPELSLTALLRQAEVVRVAPSPDINRELAALLAAGQVDAVANNRANVLGLAALVPGSRVLADRYAVQEQRINLPPGRSAASLALASDVTRQALASGLIRTSLARAGTVGVQPAAAGAPGGLPRTGGPPQPAGRGRGRRAGRGGGGPAGGRSAPVPGPLRRRRGPVGEGGGPGGRARRLGVAGPLPAEPGGTPAPRPQPRLGGPATPPQPGPRKVEGTTARRDGGRCGGGGSTSGWASWPCSWRWRWPSR